MLDFSGMRYI